MANKTLQSVPVKTIITNLVPLSIFSILVLGSCSVLFIFGKQTVSRFYSCA